MKDDDRRKRAREHTAASADNTVAQALAARIVALIGMAWLFDIDDRESSRRRAVRARRL